MGNMQWQKMIPQATKGHYLKELFIPNKKDSC